MDRVFGVSAPLALEHLAVRGDEDHLVRPDLLESDRRSLHPDAAPGGIAGGDVPPDEVALVFQAEDPAPQRNLFP
jgi:hypothetical protein